MILPYTETFTYGNSGWKDLLTSYLGGTITYDAIGNPLTYYNGTQFSWIGRQMMTALTSSGTSLGFNYNSDGLRVEKAINGVPTKYTYNGDLLVCEKNSTDTIWYTYDESGSPIGMELNGTQYYYIKNVQGDIIGIVDTNGNKVVEYTYNAWGSLRYTTGSLASTVGVKNHLRYRGYYYDVETGLYYLQSRYYDPQTGRFINADDTDFIGSDGSFVSYNLFAYCNNNPVMNVDPTGHFYISLKELAKFMVYIVGFNPVGTTLLVLGLAKLKRMITAKMTWLGFKLGKFWGPVACTIITGAFSLLGLSISGQLASALYDCINEGKKGIVFTIKKNRWGIPYKISIYAK